MRLVKSTFWTALAMWAVVAGQGISDDTINSVRENLAEAARLSWELGTELQALLELDAPSYSVFSTTPLPPPATIPSQVQSGIAPVFAIVDEIVSNRSESNGNVTGAQPLMQDGSAADPAANGVAVLLAWWTNQPGHDWEGAAQDQLDYLLTRVPQTDDGAISHRVSEVSLWSDYVFMVPPFLAYYGVLHNNESMIDEAYNQIRLYRQYLRDDNANGLWMHIVEGRQFSDRGHWSTGNGWAAAGMLRVLATIQNSQYQDSHSDQIDDLSDWTNEIHEAMYDVVDDSFIFRNYADDENAFYDAASTALLAATVYRHSLIQGQHEFTSRAERSRVALADPDNQHFDGNGWLTPVVNPHNFGAEGSESAEGQAFVLMMEAAWREWADAGSLGSGALMLGPGMGATCAWLVGVLGAMLFFA